jgi:putative copper resistance protein D
VLEAGLVISRFFHFIAVLLLFGWLLFPLAVNYGRPPPRRALVALVAFALVSGAGWFILTAGSMAGDLSQALAPATLAAVVSQTDFGPLWLARLGLIALIAAWVALAPGRQPRSPFLAAASGLAVASLAETGHAQIGDGAIVALHTAADALHLLAAGAWLGGIVGLATTLRGEADVQTTATVRSFSGLGYGAVAIVLASGLVNAWALLSGPTALVLTDYGRLLIVKILLFLAMLALAAANRLWITPKLESENGLAVAAKLRRNVLAELALGGAVVAVVSVLGTLPTEAG